MAGTTWRVWSSGGNESFGNTSCHLVTVREKFSSGTWERYVRDFRGDFLRDGRERAFLLRRFDTGICYRNNDK